MFQDDLVCPFFAEDHFGMDAGSKFDWEGTLRDADPTMKKTRAVRSGNSHRFQPFNDALGKTVCAMGIHVAGKPNLLAWFDGSHVFLLDFEAKNDSLKGSGFGIDRDKRRHDVAFLHSLSVADQQFEHEPACMRVRYKNRHRAFAGSEWLTTVQGRTSGRDRIFQHDEARPRGPQRKNVGGRGHPRRGGGGFHADPEQKEHEHADDQN